MIISKFVSILATYLSPQMCEAWFFPLIALSFVATVPCIIKMFVRW